MQQQKHYNRKERREIAKSLGLTKNETEQQKKERISRSIQAGKQIEMQFMMQVENDLRRQEDESDTKMFQSLVASLGEERAKEVMENNKKIQAEKLQKKMSKQARKK